MNSANPVGPPRRTEAQGLPSMPAGSSADPLEGRLEAWMELRERLAELTAYLEYINLMLRLNQRRR